MQYAGLPVCLATCDLRAVPSRSFAAPSQEALCVNLVLDDLGPSPRRSVNQVLELTVHSCAGRSGAKSFEEEGSCVRACACATKPAQGDVWLTLEKGVMPLRKPRAQSHMMRH